MAVHYNGGDLNFDPSRFTNAWGSGITLVPSSSLTSLAAMDPIGLWSSRASYVADDLTTMTSLWRSFNCAVASVNVATWVDAWHSPYAVATTPPLNVAKRFAERSERKIHRAFRSPTPPFAMHGAADEFITSRSTYAVPCTGFTLKQAPGIVQFTAQLCHSPWCNAENPSSAGGRCASCKPLRQAAISMG